MNASNLMTPISKRTIFALTVLGSLLLALIIYGVATAAPPAPPARYFGTSPSPNVVANDCAVADPTISGHYRVDVDTPLCTDGPYVTFAIDGVPAVEAALWDNRSLNNLDLVNECPELSAGWNLISSPDPISIDGLKSHCGVTYAYVWGESNAKVIDADPAWVYVSN